MSGSTINKIAVKVKKINVRDTDMVVFRTSDNRMVALDYEDLGGGIRVVPNPFGDGNAVLVFDMNMDTALAHYNKVNRALASIERSIILEENRVNREFAIEILMAFVDLHPTKAIDGKALCSAIDCMGTLWDTYSMYELFWAYTNEMLLKLADALGGGIAGFCYGKFDVDGNCVDVVHTYSAGCNSAITYNLTHPNPSVTPIECKDKARAFLRDRGLKLLF